jgi:hypothetical protein
MRIYYFDAPLDADELSFVKSGLISREGLRSIQGLEQVRIPFTSSSAGRLMSQVIA